MFIRKKEIKGKEYYYAVQTTRTVDGELKRVERYLGIRTPTEKDLKRYEHDFDKIKLFLVERQGALYEIQKKYKQKLERATADELFVLETELITQFTYDTSRIEGSSLTYKDTKMLLEQNIAPREKPMRDIKEAENHKKAFLYLKEQLSKDADLTKQLILKLHGLLKEGITEDAGSIRTGQVIVGNFVPIKAELVEHELDQLLAWHEKQKKLHPLELAAEFHSRFERIHPFFDGNGRVGRLLLNFILLKNKFPLVIIRNKNKRRYYTALHHADDGNLYYLLKYLFATMEKQAKEFYE